MSSDADRRRIDSSTEQDGRTPGDTLPLAHSYRLCGWRVGSERPIATLLPWSGANDHPIDVTVRFGAVAAPRTTPVFSAQVLRIHGPAEALIDHPQVARIAITDGRTITIEAQAGAPQTQVEYYAFGMGLGVLCHQRGVVPMHASALNLDGRALALTGLSGAGKSTTARSLMARGLVQVSDDILAIAPDSLLAMPSFPASNLWSDAAAMLDLADGVDPAARIRPNVEKFRLEVRAPFQAEPLPLGWVVALVRDAGVSQPEATRLGTGHAAAAIHRFLYGAPFMQAVGSHALCFRTAAALAARVPVHLLRWPGRRGAALQPLAEIVLDLARRSAG